MVPVRVSTSRARSLRVERALQIFTILSFAALGWWYFSSHQHPSANGYHVLVTALGWIGTGLAVSAAALSARKRLAYQGVGRLSAWLTGHIYIGLISAAAIFFHCGLHAGPPLTALLLTFFLLTITSGVLGWFMARRIPPLLTAMEETPAIAEDLLTIRADCLRGMLELASNGSAEFRAMVQLRLMKDATSWSRMLRFYRRRSSLAEELPAFHRELDEGVAHLRESERRAFLRAAEYALRVNKMNAELLLQRLMRGWLTLHVVSTSGMFGLAAIHIFSVLYF